MLLLESFAPSLTSSLGCELCHSVVRDGCAALAYNMTKTEATVTLYFSVDNSIEFVALDNVTQVHWVTVGDVTGMGLNLNLGLDDITRQYRQKWQSTCGDDIHHTRQRHLLLAVTTEDIHKVCLLGYIVLRCLWQLD